MDDDKQIIIKEEEEKKSFPDNSENKPDNSRKITISTIFMFCVDVFLVSILISFIMGLINPHYGPVRLSHIEKSCFSNIRVLYGAVEMYNMDHESKIDKLDDNTYNSLIEEKYLKPNGVKPLLPICKYLSQGNLATDTGIIFCECHGDIEGKIKGKYDESQISREFNKIKFKNQFSGFFYLLFFSSLFVLVSRFLFPDFLKSLKILVFAFVLMILLLLGISWLSYLLG